MKKMLIVTLILALCLSTLSVCTFAEDTEVFNEETGLFEPVGEDTATDETPEETIDADAPADTGAEIDEVIAEDVATTESAEDIAAKSKAAKDELNAKKVERAAAKIEAKEYLASVKALFADADKETRKEILAEIAAVKAELKDASIGTFVKGVNVDYEKYDGVLPVIENDRTLVPIRAVTEALGASVAWEGETSTIIAKKDNVVLLMQIDLKNAFVNGEKVELDVPPTLKNDRTMVPIRFIAEAFKLTVEWDEASQTIVID